MTFWRLNELRRPQTLSMAKPSLVLSGCRHHSRDDLGGYGEPISHGAKSSSARHARSMEPANRTWVPLHLERLTGGPPSRLKGRGQVQPKFLSRSRMQDERSRPVAPPRFWDRLEIRLDKDLDGLVAVINLDTNRCIAKAHLMASSVCSSNYGVWQRGLPKREQRR